MTASYRQSFFGAKDDVAAIGVATARAGNVIGGGDWSEDRLVPDVCRAFSKGLPVTIRNPASIRPWQHVLDPLHGYLCLAERLCDSASAFSEAWNFGPDDAEARSVEQVVGAAARAWGNGAHWINQASGDAPHEAHFLKLDCSKAKGRLDWRPRWTFDDAIQATVDWYKAQCEGRDMRRVSVDQLHAFLSGPSVHRHA